MNTLILRHPDRGSYTVAQEWTDWSLPDASPEPAWTARKLAVKPLLQLADLLAELSERTQKDCTVSANGVVSNPLGAGLREAFHPSFAT